MALNWTMLSEDGSKPVPLPGEKVFFSVERCSLVLDFASEGVKWKADGSAFVTSQRVVFVRQPPLPAPADPAMGSVHLRSLSVPLGQFLDTRYLIPIFGAPYYEACIVPSADGGLPRRAPSGVIKTGLLKIWFNEGGGMTFRDAVEEVKSRREEGATQFEALPVYEPASSGDPTAATSRAPSQLPLDTAPSMHAAPSERPMRADSLPHPDDIAVAQVAREAEERERDAERRRAHGDLQTGGPPSSHPPETNDLPPAYAA